MDESANSESFPEDSELSAADGGGNLTATYEDEDKGDEAPLAVVLDHISSGKKVVPAGYCIDKHGFLRVDTMADSNMQDGVCDPSDPVELGQGKCHCVANRHYNEMWCMLKFVERQAWGSLLHPFHGDQPQLTTVYAAYGPNPHIAAADPSEPAKPPPKSETVPGNYATHSVLPPSPPHTPTENSDHETLIANPEEHKMGAFCSLCTRLFSRQSTPCPNAPGDANSGIEMAELHRQTEDEQISATATLTQPTMSTANAMEGIQCEQIDCQLAHDTAVEVECLGLEGECLCIEAQEKAAAATRAHELLMLDRQEHLCTEGVCLCIKAQEKQAAHELLVLDRQIELAHIHTGYVGYSNYTISLHKHIVHFRTP
ncbi:hypothetical protein BDN67DRAFT_1037052 [Paxillus ammoniavirescens]|nr:hypothetical protein BDN67DRAFT_1037052 [Paxillus ammoniavirescens]